MFKDPTFRVGRNVQLFYLHYKYTHPLNALGKKDRKKGTDVTPVDSTSRQWEYPWNSYHRPTIPSTSSLCLPQTLGLLKHLVGMIETRRTEDKEKFILICRINNYDNIKTITVIFKNSYILKHGPSPYDTHFL